MLKLNNALVSLAELSLGLKGRLLWNVWKGRGGGGDIVIYSTNIPIISGLIVERHELNWIWFKPILKPRLGTENSIDIFYHYIFLHMFVLVCLIQWSSDPERTKRSVKQFLKDLATNFTAAQYKLRNFDFWLNFFLRNQLTKPKNLGNFKLFFFYNERRKEYYCRMQVLNQSRAEIFTRTRPK